MRHVLLPLFFSLSLSKAAWATPPCSGLLSHWQLKAASAESRQLQWQNLLKRWQKLRLNTDATTATHSPDYSTAQLYLDTEKLTHSTLQQLQQNHRFEIRQPLKGQPEFWSRTGISGPVLEKVQLQQSAQGPVLEFRLSPVYRQLLARLSSGLLGQKLGFYLDQQLLSAPLLKEPILNGYFLVRGLKPEVAEVLWRNLELSQLPLSDLELLGLESPQWSERSLRQLPEAVLSLLNQHYPGWVFPRGLSAQGAEQYLNGNAELEPFVVRADLDGNRTEDWGLQIHDPTHPEGPREIILIMRQMTSGQYLPEVLKESSLALAPPWAQSSLWLHPSGTQFHVLKNAQPIRATYETLSLNTWGQASVVWLWNGQSFQTLTLGAAPTSKK